MTYKAQSKSESDHHEENNVIEKLFKEIKGNSLTSNNNMDVDDDVVGINALRKIAEEGPKRHQLGLKLEGENPEPLAFAWEDILMGGEKIGDMTNCAWSRRLEQNIGYALVSADVNPGTTVEVNRGSKRVSAELCELPFL